MSIPHLPLLGRRRIVSDESYVTAANICEVLTKAIPAHQENAAEIDYLHRYRLGDQPILYKQKDVRPEINNQIVENHAKEAVDFFRGYVFGEPLQYVRVGDARADIDLNGTVDQPQVDTISEEIAKLNTVIGYYDKHAVDQDMGDWALVCGTSYRFVSSGYGDDSLLTASLDPRRTFVIYSSRVGEPPLMGVTYRVLEDDTVIYYCYTDTDAYRVTGGIMDADGEVEVLPNVLGQCIIEYPLNKERMGVFEAATSLLDAINRVSSARVDGLEQFVQAYFIILGASVTKEQMESFLELGAICLPPAETSGTRPDMKIEAQELNQADVQRLTNHFYERALTIMGLPDRGGGKASSGDTGYAVQLRDGWAEAESRARDIEIMFRKSEKAFLKVALKILANTKNPKERVQLSARDIGIKFTRNKSDNLLAKVQALQTLLASNVDPETSFKTVSLFSDPQQAYVNSKPYLERARALQEAAGHPQAISAHNKPNPEESTARNS